MRGFLQATCGVLVVIALFFGWYYIAANYDYPALGRDICFSWERRTCSCTFIRIVLLCKSLIVPVRPRGRKDIGIALVNQVFHFPVNFRHYPAKR